ncbi:MAG: tail fiber protein [Bacteroidetes bacterium]|nr:tail fiber protein [Bacteroidota bacterium]
MGKNSLVTLLVFLHSLTFFSQVGFNNPNPHKSSIVDITSNERGLLIPRMSSIQRMNINNPANGLLVYDESLQAFCQYDTIANPDKWILVNPWRANATSNSDVTLATSGNVGIGVSNPSEKLEVAGTVKTQTVSASTGTYTGTVSAAAFVGMGAVPKGSIMMWYGVVDSVPVGWVKCDGQNGTPDLRGRFVVGYDGRAADPGNGIWDGRYNQKDGSNRPNGIGGEKTHTLTVNELPKHKHTINSNAQDNGQVTISGGAHDHNSVGSDILDKDFGDVIAPTMGSNGSLPMTNPGGGSHSHTVSGNTGDGASDGLNGVPHENRPPFYVLLYIMKT